ERIAVVCAARTGLGDDVLAGLPALPVHGLGDSDARALLLANVPGPLDAAVCDQIVTESHGNPLALLELPRTWNAADLAGGFGLPDSRPVAGRIEQSYVWRLLQLPFDTQLLVLAAAAAPLGDAVLLHGAAELERSAGRAQARGGLAAAAAFLQRAVALTVDPARRAERALAAAQASLEAGKFDAALGLVAAARRPRSPDHGGTRRRDLVAA